MKGFHDDMQEQSLILEKVAQFYSSRNGKSLLQKLQKKAVVMRNKPIILSGMGSSFFVARLAATYLWSLSLPAWFLETSDLLHYGNDVLTKDSLLFLLSQSGESIEINEILDRLSGNEQIVGITNNIKSTLGQKAGLVLPILAGDESMTSSKTYTATVAVMLLVCSSLGMNDVVLNAELISKASRILACFLENNSSDTIEAIVEKFHTAKTIFLVGRGPGVATAMQGALTLKELVKIPAEGMEAAQFRHGPLEIAGKDLTITLFASPGRTDKLLYSLAKELKECGSEVVIVREGVAYDFKTSHINPFKPKTVLNEYFATLVDIYPVQYVADLLADRLGNSGEFRWISKVTQKE